MIQRMKRQSYHKASGRPIAWPIMAITMIVAWGVSHSATHAETLALPEISLPEYVPVSETLLQDRAAKLSIALDRLEDRLRSSADFEGWRSHFAIEDLRILLALPESVRPQQLATILPRYFGSQSRYDWPEVLTVRSRLIALVTALETVSIPDLEGEYHERTDQLQRLVKQHAANPASTTAIEIARQIHWLRSAGQGKELVSELRSAWAKPNFIGQIDVQTLMPKELDELVTDKSPVVDNILGTAIRGSAETQGKVSLRLVPSDDVGLFEIVLQGTTVAKTTGENGPAKIQSTSQSKFTAVTRVQITPEGLIANRPEAKATTRSNLNDLQVPRRMLPGFGEGRSRVIESFARRRAEELQPQADSIAARHSEARYEKSMAEFVAQALEKTNQPFREKFRGPLLRIGALYESIRFSTTSDAVQMQVLYADRTELGADTSPPEFRGRHALSFQLHESLIRNAGHMLLRGATLTDRELAKSIKVAFGEIPREAREYRLGDHLEPWSITLAPEHPLIVDFAEDGSTIGVRVRRITIGETTTSVNLLVLAKYRLEPTSQGPRLARVGSVQVVSDPAQTERPSTEVLDFVSRKANAFFMTEAYFDGLVPPAGGPFDKYAQLSFKELIVKDGWLAIGFGRTVPSADEKTVNKPQRTRPVR